MNELDVQSMMPAGNVTSAQLGQVDAARVPIEILNLLDIEERAATFVAPGAFDFIARGAGDEWTLRENRRAFERQQILPRIYTAVSNPDTSITLLGSCLKMPLISAPTMGHGLVHGTAESGSISGVAAAGGLTTLSTLSTHSIEAVAQAAVGPRWFQLYQQTDDGITRELIRRAEAAGYTAIVHTVDVTVGGNRESNIKNDLTWPASLPLGNFAAQGGIHRPKTDLSWADMEFVQKASSLPVIPKGILHPDDAKLALRNGAAGIWLSNHGGRQLDGAPAAFTVLCQISDIISSDIPLIVDGGFRRGQEVFKALALGASVVAIGRPVLYGLALGGALGVLAVFQHLQKELKLVMQLSGIANLEQITRAALL